MELYEGTFLMRLRDWREQYRDKPALCCENKVLSFRTLQEQAEQAAAVQSGVGADVFGGNDSRRNGCADELRYPCERSRSVGENGRRSMAVVRNNSSNDA